MSEESFKGKFVSCYILQFINVYLISKQLVMQNITKIRHHGYLNGCLNSSDGGGETPGYSRLQGGRVRPQIRGPSHSRRRNLLCGSCDQSLGSRSIYR